MRFNPPSYSFSRQKLPTGCRKRIRRHSRPKQYFKSLAIVNTLLILNIDTMHKNQTNLYLGFLEIGLTLVFPWAVRGFSQNFIVQVVFGTHCGNQMFGGTTFHGRQ